MIDDDDHHYSNGGIGGLEMEREREGIGQEREHKTLQCVNFHARSGRSPPLSVMM
jgi:hypothetical protein